MTSLKCAHCGLVNFSTATECKRCHAAFSLNDADNGSNAFAANGGSFNANGNGNSYQANNNDNSFSGHVAHTGHAQAPHNDLYYRSSGAITLPGIAAGLFGGVAIGVVLSFLYSYIIAYIPFVYVTFLCTLGYSLALGACVGKLMKWGKVRNSGVCVFVAVAVTLVSFYVSWAVWLAIMVSGKELSISSFTLVQHPQLMWLLIQKINELGAWSMFGTTFKGVELWIVWVIEAGIVMVGSPLIAWSEVTLNPFCESCQLWCDEDKSVVKLSTAESAELKRRVEAKEFEYLKSVGPKPEGASMWFRLDLHNCPNCNNTNALSVKLEKLKVDSKGKSTVETKSVMDKLLLSSNEVNHFRRISSELAQGQQAA